jgi:hypothetical protein
VQPPADFSTGEFATLLSMPTESHVDETDDLPVLRVRSPGDLVDAVPFLLGFHPFESLVLVGLSAGRVVVTARVDLEELLDSGQLGTTIAAIARGGASELVGLVFDECTLSDRIEVGETARLPWSHLALEVAAEAERWGAPAGDVLLVGRTRWWSYFCAEALCCPDEGRPRNAGPSAVSAAATYAGLVALPDRASVAALLDPVPEQCAADLERRLHDAECAAVRGILEGRGPRDLRSLKRALFAASRAADSRGAGVTLDDERLIRFAVGLSGYPVRDAVWIAIDNARLDGRELWRELARRLPGRYAAPPLFLFGWASWRAGEGGIAGIAAERALESDPDYTAADLLLAALRQGLNPRQVPRLRSARS